MLNKFSLYLLISLINLSIEIDIKKLKQFEQITVSKPTNLYLSLVGFDIGSEVYFKLIFKNFAEFSLMYLIYRQSDTHLIDDFIYFNFDKATKVDYIDRVTSYTYYFAIKVTEKNNYLLLKTPFSTSKIIIKHIKSIDHKNKLLIVIPIIVVILIIIAIIIYCKVRRKKTFLLKNTLPEENSNNLTPQNYEQKFYIN